MASGSEADRVLDVLPTLRGTLGAGIPLGPNGDSISSRRFYALRGLAGRDRTAGELARLVNIPLPSLTQVVDGLVERGWVERRGDPSDRRKVRLSLTSLGLEVYGVARLAAEALIASVLSHLDPSQRPMVVTALELLHGAIEAERPSRVPRSASAAGARRVR
jgi:DNA-binding MarR family transcriptional regulator